MFDDFLLRGLFGGIGAAIVAGALGCFVVWQRMSYFGAAIAHAALLGVAFRFLFDLEPLLGILIVAVLFAVGIYGLQRQTYLASDTVLGMSPWHLVSSSRLVCFSLRELLRRRDGEIGLRALGSDALITSRYCV